MEGIERDRTEDWVIPRGTVPTLNQLEARIDEALVIARASEDGVREVGEMALDAARQARRAAEAAEKSAEAAVEARDGARRPAGPVAAGDPPPLPVAKASSGAVPPTAPPAGGGVAPPAQPRFEVRFRSFTERADRVSERLRRIGAHPGHSAGPSVGAGRQRGDR
jgi:uncharacterized membrane protein